MSCKIIHTHLKLTTIMPFQSSNVLLLSDAKINERSLANDPALGLTTQCIELTYPTAASGKCHHFFYKSSITMNKNVILCRPKNTKMALHSFIYKIKQYSKLTKKKVINIQCTKLNDT